LLTSLGERAAKTRRTPLESSQSITAGRGIDLSGELDCMGHSCRQQQVSDLLTHAWYYFDKVVIADPIGHLISRISHMAPKEFDTAVITHTRVLLFLRTIGADSLITFRMKPEVCELHWRGHASESFHRPLLKRADALVNELAKEAQVTLRPGVAGEVNFTFNHPSFEHTVWGQLDDPGVTSLSKSEINRRACSSVIRRYIAHLTSDLRAAHLDKLPLGSTVWLHKRVLGPQTVAMTPSEVAFELELPYLAGIPMESLVDLRNEKHDEFQRFRTKLRLAATELLAERSGKNPKKIAQQIREDVIDPELRRIKEALAAAKKSFAKKVALTASLGTLATVCGLLAGSMEPVAIAAGTAAVATGLSAAASKKIDDSKDISLSDMYFLWRAVQHRRHSL
jgi:hypothetical protein